MIVQSDVELATFTTMGVGGPARWFVEGNTETDICRAVEWARERTVHVQVLGGGSNVVIADAGVDALVILINVRGVDESLAEGHVVYSVGAGEPWEAVVARSVDDNAAGLECLSGIPGRVGGTPVQNVGAYGQDVSGSITCVRAVDRLTAAPRLFTNPECNFGYRTSRFKTTDVDRFIVTQVEFALRAGGAPTIEYADVVNHFERSATGPPTLAQVRSAVLDIRRRKGMVIEAGNAANQSCGSFFVNPLVSRDQLRRIESVVASTVPHYPVDASTVKVPAAWLIERAGFEKGTARGTVGISPFQAQAIINLGSASAADVLALATDVKHAVWNVFGISIVPEPVFIGFSSSPDLRFLLSHERSH
jgi:UDP-N-acetylmuramate dehydrogenase